MAILTALTTDDVAPALAAFGVEVTSLRGLLAGSVNSNLEVETTDGRRFFARLYEEQDEAGARREADLLAALERAGVPVVPPLRRADGAGALATVRGKPFAVFPFAPGRHRCQRSVSAPDARAVGAALGRVHLAGPSLGAELTAESRFDLPALERRVAGLRELTAELAAARDVLRGDLARLGEWRPASEAAPLIHGDLFRDNVLFDEEGSPRLLDFESASRGLVAFDVMVTLLAFTFDDTLRLDLARALVAGYGGVRPLTREERADLFMAGQLACARFTATRLTDYELRPRGVGVYKDFRRWVHRKAVLEHLGAEGLERALGLA